MIFWKPLGENEKHEHSTKEDRFAGDANSCISTKTAVHWSDFHVLTIRQEMVELKVSVHGISDQQRITMGRGLEQLNKSHGLDNLSAPMNIRNFFLSAATSASSASYSI